MANWPLPIRVELEKGYDGMNHKELERAKAAITAKLEAIATYKEAALQFGDEVMFAHTDEREKFLNQMLAEYEVIARREQRE